MADDQGGSLTDLNTTQQSGVQYLGLIIQAIRETFPNWQIVPTTATDPGTPGMVAYDDTHFYVCVRTNTWVRVVLATF